MKPVAASFCAAAAGADWLQEKERLRLLAEREAAMERSRPAGGDRTARDGRSAEQIAADRKASQARACYRNVDPLGRYQHA